MSPLSNSEIQEALQNLEGWEFKEDKITKDFSFQNFRKAMAFINEVAFEAEELQHHPELFNVYNNVSISLSTHDAGNKVTAKDTELATKIEALLR